MGVEIHKSRFDPSEEEQFRERLREETKHLMRLFREERFSDTGDVIGLELEGWLLNSDFEPAARNTEFLAFLNDSKVTSELSQYSFEINVDPLSLTVQKPFSTMERSLLETWNRCMTHAERMGLHALLVGIPASMNEQMLRPEFLSKKKRYAAMNQRILDMREGKPVHVLIENGRDGTLDVSHPDIMLDSAASSLQAHIQVKQSESVRFWNASKIASAPMVGISANSPYFLGKDLWDETRIPLFEQGAFLRSFRNAEGEIVGRVDFGDSYCHDSWLEMFLENLDGHPFLLPEVDAASDPRDLFHLKLQNGTVWRWNRPIIGVQSTATEQRDYHLRIEHRSASSGPTIADCMANTAFFVGLSYCLARMERAPETLLPHEHCRTNFYEAARDGIHAEVHWLDGKRHKLQKLLLDRLIPDAADALSRLGIDRSEAEHYLFGILAERVKSDRGGAAFQREFIRLHDRDFKQMLRSYFLQARENIPVHQWEI